MIIQLLVLSETINLTEVKRKNWKRIVFSTNSAGTIGYSHTKR